MKRYFSSIHIIWLFLVCSLLSCKREESALKPASEKRPVSVEEAQHWFARQITAAEGRRNGTLPERKPRWEAAERITLSNGVPALALPLEYKSGGLGTGGLTRLLFFVKQGQLQSQIMKLVSDSVYFYRNKQQIKLENLFEQLMKAGLVEYDEKKRYQLGVAGRRRSHEQGTLGRTSQRA
jgi:hypothetical protein